MTTVPQDLASFVRGLPTVLGPFREMLLANLVMIGEIPAPTFHEDARIDFLKQRFTECSLHNVSTDEVGNGVGILRGTEGKRRILVTAHVDTPFVEDVDSTLSVDPNYVTGPGVADNSLGVAVLATLPTVLEGLEIRLRSDLVLMGATRSLGRGNLAGLRFFLTHSDLPLLAGVSVEGAHLGRLHYTSLASMNGEIICRVTQPADPSFAGGSGAILIMHRLIERLRAIPLPRDPLTTMVFGSLRGGTAFQIPARSTTLRFQIRSESDEQVNTIAERIDTIADEVAEDTGASVSFEVIARSNSGGLSPDHRLVRAAHEVITALDIEPRMGCCSSAASSFIERGIPALTVGVTTALNLNEGDEKVAIKPMLKGMAQVVGILMAIDGGCCDQH